MDLSGFLTQCGCFSADQTTIDYLPSDQPAVYAFFDSFRFPSIKIADHIDEFATTYARTIELETDEIPNYLKIKLRGNKTRFKGKGLKLAKGTDATTMENLLPVMAFLSIFNEPLYIGETNDVKLRFRAHHDTGFLFRMKTHLGRPPGSFVFFYLKTDPEVHKLLEAVLIHLISPAHNVTGNIIT